MQTTLKTSRHSAWVLPVAVAIWMLLQAYLTAWLSQALHVASTGGLMLTGLLAGVLALALMAFFRWMMAGD